MPGLGVGIAVGITPGGGAGFPYYGLICLLDSALGVATAEASVTADLSSWSKARVDVTGSDPYTATEQANSGTHVAYTTSNFAQNHPATFTARLKRGTGTRDGRLLLGGSGTIFDLGSGTVIADTGDVDSSPISGPDGSGYYLCQVVTSAQSSTSMNLYVTDGATTGYLGDGSSSIVATDIAVEQVRVETISSQSPATGPYATNANVDEQPYYGDGTGGIVFDGVDDSLKFAAPLGAHTSHTLYFRLDLAAGAGDQYILEAETGPLVIGRNSGTLGVYDGSWHEVQGAAGTDALSDALVEVVLDGVAGTMVVTIDGVAATLDDATYTPVAVNGAGTLGSNYSQDAAFAEMTLYDLVLYSRVLTVPERAAARTELSA